MQILSFKSLTAGTLLAASLTAVTASAADLPRRAPAPAPAAVYTPVAPGPAVTSAAISAVRGVAEKSTHPSARFLVLVPVPVSPAAARSDAIIRPGPGCLAFAICSTQWTRVRAAPSRLARLPVTPPSLKTAGWICSQVALATRHSRTGCFISRVALLGGRMNSHFSIRAELMCLTPTEPALAGRLVSAPNGSSRQIGQRLWNTITRTSAPTAALSTVRYLAPSRSMQSPMQIWFFLV